MQRGGSLLTLRSASGLETERSSESRNPSVEPPLRSSSPNSSTASSSSSSFTTTTTTIATTTTASAPSASHTRRHSFSSFPRRIRISPSPTRRNSIEAFQRKNSLPSDGANIIMSSSSTHPTESTPINNNRSVNRSMSPSRNQTTFALVSGCPSPCTLSRTHSGGLSIYRRSSSVPRKSHATPVVGFVANPNAPVSPCKLPSTEHEEVMIHEVVPTTDSLPVVASKISPHTIKHQSGNGQDHLQTDELIVCKTSTLPFASIGSLDKSDNTTSLFTQTPDILSVASESVPLAHSLDNAGKHASEIHELSSPLLITLPTSPLVLESAPGTPICMLPSPKPIPSPIHSPSSASFHTPSPLYPELNDDSNLNNTTLSSMLPLFPSSASSPPFVTSPYFQPLIALSLPRMSYADVIKTPPEHKGSPMSMSNYAARPSTINSVSLPLITSLSCSPSLSKSRITPSRMRKHNDNSHHRSLSNSNSKRVSVFDFGLKTTPSPEETSVTRVVPVSPMGLIERNVTGNASQSALTGTGSKHARAKSLGPQSSNPPLKHAKVKATPSPPQRHNRNLSHEFHLAQHSQETATPHLHFHQDFKNSPPRSHSNMMTKISSSLGLATSSAPSSPVGTTTIAPTAIVTNSTPISPAVAADNSSPNSQTLTNLGINGDQMSTSTPTSNKRVRSLLRSTPPSRPPPLTPTKSPSANGEVVDQAKTTTPTSNKLLRSISRSTPPSRPPPPTPPRGDVVLTIPSPRENSHPGTPHSPPRLTPKLASPASPKILRPNSSKGSPQPPLLGSPLTTFGASPSPKRRPSKQTSASRYQFNSSPTNGFVATSPADSVILEVEGSPRATPQSHFSGKSAQFASNSRRGKKLFEVHEAPASSYPPIEYEDEEQEASTCYPSIHYEYEHKEVVDVPLVPCLTEEHGTREDSLRQNGDNSLWRFLSSTGLCIFAVLCLTIATVCMRPPSTPGPMAAWALLLLCHVLCLSHYLARRAVPEPLHPSEAVKAILHYFPSYKECEELFSLLPAQQHEGWINADDFSMLLNQKKCSDESDKTTQYIIDCILREFDCDENGNFNLYQFLSAIKEHTRGNCFARLVLRARLDRFAVPASSLPLVAILFEIATLTLQACVLLTASIPSTSIYIFGAFLLVLMAAGSLFLREMARVFPPFQWLGIIFLVIGSFLFTVFCLAVEEQSTLIFFAGFVPQVHSFVISVSVCYLIAHNEARVENNRILEALYALSRTKNTPQVAKSTLLSRKNNNTLSRASSFDSLHETKRLVSDSPFQIRRPVPTVPLSPITYRTNLSRTYRSAAPSPSSIKHRSTTLPTPAPVTTAKVTPLANTMSILPSVGRHTINTTTATTTNTTTTSTQLSAHTAPPSPAITIGSALSQARQIDVPSSRVQENAGEAPSTPKNAPIKALRPRSAKRFVAVSPLKTTTVRQESRSYDRPPWKERAKEHFTMQSLYRICAVVVAILAILIGLSVGVRLFEGPSECVFPIACRTTRYIRGLSFVPVCECDDVSVDWSARSLAVLPSLAQFTRLTTLNISSNLLIELPATFCVDLPLLAELDVSLNKLTTLPSCFDGYASLLALNISLNSLSSISSLPPSLYHLNVSSNSLTELPNLPSSIRSLDCSSNRLSLFTFSSVTLERLDLSHNQIISLPDLVFPRLTHLSLTNNLLATLPRLRTPELKEFYCAQNNLETLPDSLGNLLELGVLDAKGNKVTQLPTVIANLKALQSIDLSNNMLRVFPSVLLNCSSLIALAVSSNQLADIPALVSELPLEVLEVDSNQLAQLPKFAVSLRKLNISSNNIQMLPSSLTEYDQLESLDVSNNSILSLPILHNLTKLKALFLSHNRVSTFPFGLAPSIEILSLTHNLLTVLPESIQELPRLTSLDLSNNGLSVWPSAFTRLVLLESLKLSHNRLSSIPSDFSLPTNSSLKELFIDGNNLALLPSWLTRLPSLEVLNIASNGIATFLNGPWASKTFCCLIASDNNLTYFGPLSLPSSLHVLNVSGNRMAEDFVSRLVVSCPSLKSLDLSRNDLATFPHELSQFQQLEVLSLAHNHFSPPLSAQSNHSNGGTRLFAPGLIELDLTNTGLTSLPLELSHITSLRYLTVNENDLTVLPAWLCGLTSLVAANNSIDSLQFVANANSALLLPRLQTIDLSSNEISGVDGDVILQLSNLRELNLAHNWIFSLPLQFLNLNNLQSLSLNDNPICHDVAAAPLPPTLVDLLRDTKACRFDAK